MRIHIRYIAVALTLAVAALLVAFVAVSSFDSTAPASAADDHAQIMWGDINCDGSIDALDTLTMERHLLGLPPAGNDCAPAAAQAGPAVLPFTLHPGDPIKALAPDSLAFLGLFGNTDCKNNTDVQDALNPMKSKVGLSVTQVVGCPKFGSLADISKVSFDLIPDPTTVPFVGVDAITTGNTASSVGDIEECVAPHVGDTFTMDVVALGIPFVFSDNHSGTIGGIGGMGLQFNYDPALVEIEDANIDLMLNADHTGAEVGSVDFTPNTNGHWTVSVFDPLGSVEAGDGVLVRLTMKALAAGRSAVFINDPNHLADPPQIVDGSDIPYTIGSLGDAEVKVDGDCAAGTLTPSPSPTASGGPNTETPTPTASPTHTPTPTPTTSPTPTPSAAPNQCTSGTPIDIPDNEVNGVTDSKTLNTAGTISNMSLCLNISTVWSGDLTATLTHVGTGSNITLFSRLGGTHQGSDTCHNGIDTNIHVYLTDDTGVIQESLEEACENGDPLDGNFPPVQPFAVFNGPFAGEAIAGEWQLFVSDNNADGFTAQILGWKLFFNLVATPTPSVTPP